MINVQCESCHGPGARHARDPVSNSPSLSPDAELCRHCHDNQNSPDFAFEEYWDRINH
jgi:hypothetical protein